MTQPRPTHPRHAIVNSITPPHVVAPLTPAQLTTALCYISLCAANKACAIKQAIPRFPGDGNRAHIAKVQRER